MQGPSNTLVCTLARVHAEMRVPCYGFPQGQLPVGCTLKQVEAETLSILAPKEGDAFPEKRSVSCKSRRFSLFLLLPTPHRPPDLSFHSLGPLALLNTSFSRKFPRKGLIPERTVKVETRNSEIACA